MRAKRLIPMLFALALAVMPLMGCVDQNAGRAAAQTSASAGEELRVATTSVAIMEIMERLNVDLVGVPTSDSASFPERYAEVERVGMPMNPDMEILRSLSPDIVLSPVSLMPDLASQYEAAGITSQFMNLSTLEGMYTAIAEVGTLLKREEEAQVLIDEYESFINEYTTRVEGNEQPRVLILMGLPGSYTVATENSYVGSLIKIAGGINVYEGETEEFVNVNTEDMLARDPDIILRTAHALPSSVMKMFAEEFEENDIWKHFRAVEEGRVYDLNYEEFGMSANFYYQDALNNAYSSLYEGA